MENTNIKSIAYISYGKNEFDLTNGTFDNIPADSTVAIITLKTPYKTEFGEIKYNEYYHRIFYGVDIPTKKFIDDYNKSISKDKLEYLNNKINEGKTRIVIPIDNKSEDFIFASEKDKVYKDRNEFENIIHDFKEKYNTQISFAEPKENTTQIKL